MPRDPKVRGLLLAVFLLLVSLYAVADSRARIVRLSFIEGDVELEQRDGDGYRKAFLNMPIGQGTQIALHGDARAEIEFENGSTLRLAREAQLGFTELGLRDDGNKFTVLDVTRGTVYGDIKKSSSDQFDIRVLRRSLELRKSVRFRINLDADNAQISVLHGELNINADGHGSELKKNQTISFERENEATLAFDNRVVSDPLDSWDNERRDYRDRYFSASSYNYPSAYRYGFADLAYYGDYVVVPGWGRVWRPYGVDAGWQPYQDGTWVWYPYSGWTWVSAYPWGWSPYRYGSWHYLGGYGWCWRPSYSYVTWVPVVTVVNPPPIYRVPSPPVGHGGPPVYVGNAGGGNIHSGRENWYREIRDNDPHLLGGAGGKQIGPAPPRKEIFEKDERVPPAAVMGHTESGKPIIGPAPPQKRIVNEDEGASGQAGAHGKPPVGPAPPQRRLADEENSADNSTGKPVINPAPPTRKVTDDNENPGGNRGTGTGPAPPERRIVNQNDSSGNGSGGYKNPSPPPAPPQRGSGDGNSGMNNSNSGSYGGGASRAPAPPPPPPSSGSGYSGGSGGHSSGGYSSGSGGPSHSSGGSGSGSPKSDSGVRKFR